MKIQKRLFTLPRQVFNDFQKVQDLKSKDQELITYMQKLNSQQPIDFNSVIEQAAKMERNEFSQEEINRLEEEEKIKYEKLKQVENSRKYISFFNKHAQLLIKKTPSEILVELGVRAYSGSRDVPKDVVKANGFFDYALENEINQQQIDQIKYFKTITERFRLMQEWLQYKQNIDKMPEQLENEIFKLNNQLTDLAVKDNPLAAFSYAEDIYKNIRNEKLENSDENFYRCLHYFNLAANKGVYNAHFYLGLIYYDDVLIETDPDKALDHYIRGAAKNNAFCFFELSRIYSEGIIIEKPNHALSFLYLKRSAEEGFVSAQHLLGIAYHDGILCEKNDVRSLAWFRESIRNGNYVSYLNAAEILDQEGSPLRNLLFSFVNYLGAYQHGAFFLQEKIEKLRKKLINVEGFKIPEIKFVNETDMNLVKKKYSDEK